MAMFHQITNFDTKRYEVIDAIKNDIPAADLKISLLLVACRSAHYQSKVAGNRWNIDRKCFLDVLQNIPGVPMLLTIYKNPKMCIIDENVLDFLHWLMVIRCDPKIESVSSSYKQLLQSLSEPQDIDNIPNYMFHLEYCPCTKYSNEWDRNTVRFRVKYGYVATNLEDGFLKIFNGMKMSAKKKPLCLNSNINETYRQQSYFQQSWCKSLLGVKIKVLLAVEFIDHPNLVSVWYRKGKLVSTSPKYNIGVKGKRFIIGDPALARCAYVLVFRKPDYPQCCRALYLVLMVIAILFTAVFAVLLVCTIKIKPPAVRTY